MTPVTHRQRECKRLCVCAWCIVLPGVCSAGKGLAAQGWLPGRACLSMPAGRKGGYKVACKHLCCPAWFQHAAHHLCTSACHNDAREPTKLPVNCSAALPGFSIPHITRFCTSACQQDAIESTKVPVSSSVALPGFSMPHVTSAPQHASMMHGCRPKGLLAALLP